MTAHDVSFPSMGSTARIVAEGADAAPARDFLAAFERRLTRFDERSELCALNRSPQRRRAGLAAPAARGPRRAVGRRALGRPGGPDDPARPPCGRI